MIKLQTVIRIVLILVFSLRAGIAGAESKSIREILLKGIEVNFSGDYDRAAKIFSTISEIDPNHPSQPFYQAVVLFWKSSVDEGNPPYVNQIRKHLNASINQSENMLSADANDPDALHYLGLAYTYLGRLEAHHGNLYKGGVFGERGRNYLEKAIGICEQQYCPAIKSIAPPCGPCEDIYFPLGAYSYFAGRLPQFLKAFNFLWFIPSGSTKEGLQDLERALRNSDLHCLGAQSLLADIFLSFETDRIRDGEKLSADLVSRFPDNPYLEIQHARLLMASGQNQEAAERIQTIIAKVNQGVRNYDAVVLQRGLLLKAEAAIRQSNISGARQILAQIKKNPAFQANSLTPHTNLLLGMLADIEMKREQAIRFYEQAESFNGVMHNRIVARKAKQYLKKPFTRSDKGSS